MTKRTLNYPDGRPYHAPLQEEQTKEKKPSKYHNRKTLFLGILFDSQREANRYQELLWLEQAGEICHIELQPRYRLVVNDQYIGFYKADFRYEIVATGAVVVEDVKCSATKTPLYRIKKKLIKAIYGIEIVEVE